MRGLVWVALVLLAMPAGLAWGMGAEVAMGGWSGAPGGSVSYQASGFNDAIDLADEAGYGREYGLSGRVRLDMPLVLPNLYVMATPVRFTGDGVKGQGFRFGEQEFVANIPFRSELEMNHYDLGFYYGMPLLGTATLHRLELEGGVNLRYLELTAQVEQEQTGLAQSTSEGMVLPMLYLAARLQPAAWLAVEVEGRGLAYSGNHYCDFIARLKYIPFTPIFGAVGWRREDVRVDESDIEAELKVSGPFVEAGFTFDYPGQGLGEVYREAGRASSFP